MSWTKQETINSCKDTKTGLINEFELMYKVRSKFPLHYTVFKQVSAHMAHEANTVQLFSLAGNTSDPSKDALHLARQCRVAKNKAVFMPSIKEIWNLTIYTRRSLAKMASSMKC